MAANLGSLVVSLGLDAAEYTRGLEKSKREADRATRDIQRLFDGARNIGAGIGVGAVAAATSLAVGAVAAATSLAVMAKNTIDAADHLLDLSKATNITVEQLGGIGFAASQAGSDLDGAAASLGKLNLTIAKAAAGDKEASALFASMGISVRDAAGATRSADAVFADVAAKFATYAEGPEQAALGNALFGKSYQSILPLLKDGGATLQDNIAFYRQFGGVSSETAKQADQFNDSLGKLTLIGTGLGRTLVGELLPSLNAVADRLLNAAKRGDLFLQFLGELNNIANPASKAGSDLFTRLFRDNPQERIDKLKGTVADLQKQLQANPGDRGLEAYLAKVQKRLADVTASTSLVPDVAGESFRKALKNSGAAFSPPTAAPKIGGGAAAKAAQETTSEAERYLATLQRQLDKTNALTQEEMVRLELGRGMKGLNDRLADQIIDRAVELDLAKQMTDQLAAEKRQVEDLRAAMSAQADEGRRVFESTRTPAEQLAAEIERLNVLLNAGAVNWDTYARATSNAQDAFDKATAPPKIPEVATDAQKAAQTIEETLGSGLYDTLSGNFNGIGDAFQNLLKRLVADALAAKVTEALFGDSAPGKSSVGGGGSNAGIYGAILQFFAGGFADGGYIPPGRWGWTGERGPEPVFGGRTGVTVRSAAENSGGAVIQAGIGTVNVGAGVSRGEMNAAISQALARQTAQIQRARSEGRL